MQAPPEELACVAIIDPTAQRLDAIDVVGTRSGSKSYERLVGQLDMPRPGDELHCPGSGRRGPG
jgi:selenium-binding protein 1